MITNIVIKEPIWKTRSVGIARSKLYGDISVQITYKDRMGNRVYPHKYFMARDKALSYPVQTVRRNIDLKIIPIADFQVITN